MLSYSPRPQGQQIIGTCDMDTAERTWNRLVLREGAQDFLGSLCQASGLFSAGEYVFAMFKHGLQTEHNTSKGLFSAILK